MEPAEKFDIFHQGYLWKSANVEEGRSPAEYAVIAAPHAKQNSCVMSKAVRESIDQTSWEANPKIPARNIRIIHDLGNVVQTSLRESNVGMQEPKYLAASDASAGIHLPCSTAIALHQLIAKFGGEPICAIGTSAVRNNDLRFRRSLAKVPKKRPYQRCLVKNRDND
jgi:hypothetical protein